MPCTVENPAAAAAHDAPRPAKEAVLPQICAAALAGQSCRQLAATFRRTKSTVSRWLQELREGCPMRVETPGQETVPSEADGQHHGGA